MDRFDVISGLPRVSIDYHFCRDEECFGTSGTHGYSFDEAKEVVISQLERQLRDWRAMSFEDWRRNNHPTEKEMDEDLSKIEQGTGYIVWDEYYCLE